MNSTIVEGELRVAFSSFYCCIISEAHCNIHKDKQSSKELISFTSRVSEHLIRVYAN